MALSSSHTLANRWLVLGVVSVALFLIVIDMTVLYTALPRLTHDLHASVSEKLWIVNAYSLVMAGLLPATGALCDRLGHKAIFVWGLLVFGVASIIAAFSPNPEVLIASRVLLAIGAAMMMPATLSIIRHVFEDPDERAFAIGVWAAVASGGAAFGPLVGGALLEFFWWGSVFLINVPLVLLAMPAALAFIPASAGDPTHPRHIVSSCLILVGLVSVAYAIKGMGMRTPSWSLIAGASAMGVASLWAFVRYQKRAHMPLIDFAIFKDARFFKRRCGCHCCGCRPDWRAACYHATPAIGFGIDPAASGSCRHAIICRRIFCRACHWPGVITPWRGAGYLGIITGVRCGHLVLGLRPR